MNGIKLLVIVLFISSSLATASGSRHSNTPLEELSRASANDVANGSLSPRSSNRIANRRRRKSTALPKGLWGGRGAELTVTDERAEIEFDCGYGIIEKPIALNAAKRFQVTGKYADDSGGAAAITGARQENGSMIGTDETHWQAAVFTGALKGTKLTITVKLRDVERLIGTFTLTKDEPARLLKCRI